MSPHYLGSYAEELNGHDASTPLETQSGYNSQPGGTPCSGTWGTTWAGTERRRGCPTDTSLHPDMNFWIKSPTMSFLLLGTWGTSVATISYLYRDRPEVAHYHREQPPCSPITDSVGLPYREHNLCNAPAASTDSVGIPYRVHCPRPQSKPWQYPSGTGKTRPGVPTTSSPPGSAWTSPDQVSGVASPTGTGTASWHTCLSTTSQIALSREPMPH